MESDASLAKNENIELISEDCTIVVDHSEDDSATIELRTPPSLSPSPPSKRVRLSSSTDKDGNMTHSMAALWRQFGGTSSIDDRNHRHNAHRPPKAEFSCSMGSLTDSFNPNATLYGFPTEQQLQMTPWPFVWEFLEPEDILCLTLVCKHWRSLGWKTVKHFNMDKPFSYVGVNTGRRVEELLRLCPNLCHVNVGHWQQPLSTLVQHLSEQSTQLVSLRVFGAQYKAPASDTVASLPVACPALKVLHLNHCSVVRTKDAPALFRLPKLRELSLCDSKKLGDKAFTNASSICTQLVSLDLSGCTALKKWDLIAKQVPNVKRLRGLNLPPPGNAEAKLEDPILGGRLVHIVKGFPQLEELHVSASAQLIPPPIPRVADVLKEATSSCVVKTMTTTGRVVNNFMPPVDVKELQRKFDEAAAVEDAVETGDLINNIWMDNEDRAEMQRRLDESRRRRPVFVKELAKLKHLHTFVIRANAHHMRDDDTAIELVVELVQALPSLHVLIFPHALYTNVLTFGGVAEHDEHIRGLLASRLTRLTSAERVNPNVWPPRAYGVERPLYVKLGHVVWATRNVSTSPRVWFDVGTT